MSTFNPIVQHNQKYIQNYNKHARANNFGNFEIIKISAVVHKMHCPFSFSNALFIPHRFV